MAAISRPIVLASALIVVAGGLALRPRGGETEEEPEVQAAGVAKTHTRPVLESRGVRVRDLVRAVRTTPFEKREAWAASLSDEELRRLSLELLDEFVRADEPDTTVVPWLCALSIEFGERDYEGFAALIDEWSLSNPAGAAVVHHAGQAALVGLARHSPAKAFESLSEPFRTNADFISPLDAQTIPGIPLIQTGTVRWWPSGSATEAIFREWGKQDPKAALAAVSGAGSGAYRGLLATTGDPGMIERILEQLKSDPSSLGFMAGSTSFVNLSNVRTGDAAIERNSIDAILNNPHRFSIPSLATSVGGALAGVAEHDPHLAWDLAEFDEVNRAAPEQAQSPVATSTTRESLLSNWTARDPEGAIRFLTDLEQGNPSAVVSDHWISTARELFKSDPVRAYQLLEDRGLDGDPMAFNQLRYKHFMSSPQSTWPLFDGLLPAQIPGHSESEMIRLVGRLALEPEQKAAWIDYIESSDPFAPQPELPAIAE
ncbi:hypothetical protein HAHE_21600 [Haloferula helveola]|uniref:Secreted protein n=1 Tax=Haloferula helveola TaxID=490095 RepID=A0ABM7RE69_9BACT|nr:hypothetical protein HAHE_21600 [Haloferula helveola]